MSSRPRAPRPSPPRDRAPDALVLGATGLIGRRLLAELLGRGRSVAAGTRGGGRESSLLAWLRGHGVPTDRLTPVRVDVTRPDLGLDPADARSLRTVRDVYNCAALFRFGMGREEARAANVDGALHVLAWSARLDGLRRVVHITGYRAASVPEHGTAPGRGAAPAPAGADRLYRDLGAYEASKIEADAAVRALAEREGLPLSIVNPATVIGDSETGEAGQYIGLAETVRDLWRGRLPLVPGGPATFVPVVTADHLARFLAAVPEHDTGGTRAHWVLDESTPNLPELVRDLAAHLGVRAPRGSVPVGLLRRLPRAVTGVEPETLSFLSRDRYDTASANALSHAAGLTHPPVRRSLSRWADRLVSEGFGELPEGVPETSPHGLPGGLHPVAGGRTYLAGDRISPAYVLLHGLPLDGDSWHPAAGLLDGPILVPDLPGLGRSGPVPVPVGAWLSELLSPVVTRPVLVGHSEGCAPLLRYAHAHPDRVGGLVLIAPAFLQRRASPLTRPRLVTRAALRRASADGLGPLLGLPVPAGDLPHGPAGAPAASTARVLAGAALNLRRPGAAARAANALAAARRPAERAEARSLLASCPVPVTVVEGERDPLDPAGARPAVVGVPGTGRHPHLVAPEAVADAILSHARSHGNAPAGGGEPAR